MGNEYKNILNNYILEHKEGVDIHHVRGSFAFSYNYSLDYICVYKIESLGINDGYYYINSYPYKLEDKTIESYEIKDYFFKGVKNYRDVLGENFINNSIDTQFRKIRSYFAECDF